MKSIEKLLNIGENLVVEFKESYDFHNPKKNDIRKVFSKEDLMDDVCAMANASGGRIFIGIGEGKNSTFFPSPIKGDFGSIALQISNIISQYADPFIADINISKIDLGDGFAVCINIPKSRTIHVNKLNGKMLRRLANRNHAMSYSEISSRIDQKFKEDNRRDRMLHEAMFGTRTGHSHVTVYALSSFYLSPDLHPARVFWVRKESFKALSSNDAYVQVSMDGDSVRWVEDLMKEEPRTFGMVKEVSLMEEGWAFSRRFNPLYKKGVRGDSKTIDLVSFRNDLSMAIRELVDASIKSEFLLPIYLFVRIKNNDQKNDNGDNIFINVADYNPAIVISSMKGITKSKADEVAKMFERRVRDRILANREFR